MTRQHVVAVQLRVPDEYEVESVVDIVHLALRERGYEAVVFGGQRTVSNYGEHLARLVQEEGPDV